MRPATIASLEVDGLKPARLLVVALLRFVLIVSALVAPAAGRMALVVANSSYAYMPLRQQGSGRQWRRLPRIPRWSRRC